MVLTTTIIPVGHSPARTYQDLPTALAASDAKDFVTDDEEYIFELYDDDQKPFALGASTSIVLDNQNTDATRRRRIRAAAGHEFDPHTGGGVRIVKTLDGSAGGDWAIDIHRENGFFLGKRIGCFLTTDGAITTGTSGFLRISGDDCEANGLYFEWMLSGFSTSAASIHAISIENRTTPTAKPDASVVQNCIVLGDTAQAREGISVGLFYGAALAGAQKAYQNSVFGCITAGMQMADVTVKNCVCLENGTDFAGTATAVSKNLSSDGTGQDDADQPRPNGADAWLHLEARDFRLRNNSAALAYGDDLSSDSAADTTDYIGTARTGLRWDGGALDGATAEGSAVPTVVTTTIGKGNLHEHPEQWERGSRGHLVAANERRVGSLEKWPGEPHTLDNDVTDDPEDLSALTGGWGLTNVTDTQTGDLQPTTSALPWGFGLTWTLESKATATNMVGTEGNAGVMAANGSYNCVVVLVRERSGASFRINIRNQTDAVSHVADFDWTAGIPVLDSASANVTTFVRGPMEVGGKDWFAVQVNYQSQAADAITDARSVILYTPKAAGPFPSQDIVYGFVRVATRTTDQEIAYCSGSALEMKSESVVSDLTRYRSLEAASASVFDPSTLIGARVEGNLAGSILDVRERYARVRSIFLENLHASDVARRCVFAVGRNIQLDGVSGRCSAGGSTATSEIVRVESPSRSVLVANSVLFGSGTSTGARRGLTAGADTTGKVYNCVADDFTSGADGTGFELLSGGSVFFRNCIAVDCDVGFAVAESRMDHCLSSDATALGVGSLINQTSSLVFQDVANGDYRLRPTSPALDSGVYLGFDFSTDVLRVARRSPWEMGAFDGFASAPFMAAVELSPVMSLCSVWDIERRDGNAHRFTDNDEPVPVQGQTYTPVAGLESSSRRVESGLRESGAEVLGVVTSAEISDTDLRSGRFRGALVRERVIDPRRPYAEPLAEYLFRILDVQFSGEFWRANIVGLSQRMQRQSGRVTTLTCRNTLGDFHIDGTRDPTSDCRKDILADTQFSTAVSTVVNVRRKFEASSISAGFADAFFAAGEFMFETGANAGIVTKVKTYTQATREVELADRMPSDIVAGDQFRMQPGCRKRHVEDCIGKFANGINFGGEPFTPGTDKSMQTPTS